MNLYRMFIPGIVAGHIYIHGYNERDARKRAREHYNVPRMPAGSKCHLFKKG